MITRQKYEKMTQAQRKRFDFWMDLYTYSMLAGIGVVIGSLLWALISLALKWSCGRGVIGSTIDRGSIRCGSNPQAHPKLGGSYANS
jgi:hypothetical protein